jgi:hypothetical protein
VKQGNKKVRYGSGVEEYGPEPFINACSSIAAQNQTHSVKQGAHVQHVGSASCCNAAFFVLERRVNFCCRGIEVMYCEDTRPHNQLNAAQEQRKDLCALLR